MVCALTTEEKRLFLVELDWFPSFIKLYSRYAYNDRYQVENPTHETAHARKRIFNTDCSIFSVAII